MAQPKSGTLEGITVEEYARKILTPLIKLSVDDQREYGGVIYRNVSTGELGKTGPFKGDSPTNVDVKVWAPKGKTQKEWNAGCPAGTKPVAWYHTHPVEVVMTHGGVLMHANWDKFEGGDVLISDSLMLTGYVATWDRQLWRYDFPKPAMYNGELVPSADAQGTFVPLNGKL